MPMSRATARSDRLAPSVSRWRRATALISPIISARTLARIDAAGMQRLLHTFESSALAFMHGLCQTGARKRERCSLKSPVCRSAGSRTRDRSTEMAKHVIVGAGAVGSATALLLAERGEQVRIVTRRGSGPDHPGIEKVTADATDAARLSEITAGAAALYNCASPQYHQWFTDWPPLAAAFLTTAERTGAVYASMSNLYGYGPVDGPMTPQLPVAATHPKLRLRAEMWNDMLAAQHAGRIRTVEVRASDYIEANSILSTVIGKSVLAGKRAYAPGPLDVT